MSVDLEAWFAVRPRPEAAPAAGQGWVLHAEGPLRVADEDIPEALRPWLGRCRWRVDLHLEGRAEGAGGAALAAWAERLVRDEGALVWDPQAETLATREGVRAVPRLEALPGRETGYKLAVLFERADRVDRARIAQCLEAVAAELPEALPHRYGRFEPPQGRWAEGGLEAFLADWDRHDPPFWIGKTPAGLAYTSFDHPAAPQEAFRAGLVEIAFRPALARDPGRLLAALRLTERLASILDAFYAALVPDQNDHGPWWKGLYPGAHLALVLGPPLIGAWPEFAAASAPLGSRHRAAGLLHGGAIEPPARLCFPIEPIEPELLALAGGRSHRPARGYAQVFPFPKRDPYR